MRKGIADINLRAKVSDDRLNSFSEHLASFKNKTPVDEIVSHFVKPFQSNGKRIRGLDILGKDRALLQAISDHIFNVNSMHGIIKKLPNQRKYSLTEKGRNLTSVLKVTLTASADKLLEMAT